MASEKSIKKLIFIDQRGWNKVRGLEASRFLSRATPLRLFDLSVLAYRFGMAVHRPLFEAAHPIDRVSVSVDRVCDDRRRMVRPSEAVEGVFVLRRFHGVSERKGIAVHDVLALTSE